MEQVPLDRDQEQAEVVVLVKEEEGTREIALAQAPGEIVFVLPVEQKYLTGRGFLATMKIAPNVVLKWQGDKKPHI
jgi:hypothetical protein